MHLFIQGVMKIDPTAQCHDPEMPANDDATMYVLIDFVAVGARIIW